ncbi:30S ribosomal protein s20 [Plakobranchus ocellatus]|uniref:30S ribosomal protein s20 n=1 Tax=Plakobranchus ocellatus TaxID=259542 RepID=A0AAV4B002_9GAST|nr:30S ribosomal protein s20 [Plakobranchus ocellatus]
MFNSKKNTGTFHEKDTTFTIYPNLDHVSDQSDGKAETTLVNTSNSDQDRGRNNNSLFTCDEISLCGASLSEFDKDVVQSSPKPERHFEECSTNSSNTKSVHKGKSGKILEGIFQEKLTPLEPVAGQSCESLTVNQGTNMSEMDISRNCTNSKIYRAEDISSKNSKGISNIGPTVGCNNQHAEDKTSKLLPATQSQECEEIWVDEPESGIEPLEFTSKHLSYQELQELGLVKTCFEITEQSSPINGLESTANDDSITSPQLSQEDMQFLENVNRVKKNLNMELGKDSYETVSNNKSVNDIFSPSSVTTLSFDLYLSDSISKNAPSPGKKAKTVVPKRQQQVGKSLSKEIQLNEASQRVSYVSIKCDSPSVSRSVDLANVQFLDKNLLESDVKSSQVKFSEPLRSEDQDQELEEGEIDDVDECKDDSSATSLNAKSNLAYTEEDMPSRSHHQETYRPKYKTTFSVKRQKTNKHLESIRSGLSHRVSPLERVYNGQTINESTSKKIDSVSVKGKDNPSVPSTSKGETNLNKSDKDKISRRHEDDFAHRHSRKSAQSYDLKVGLTDSRKVGLNGLQAD